jgi:hypothetical protein
MGAIPPGNGTIRPQDDKQEIDGTVGVCRGDGRADRSARTGAKASRQGRRGAGFSLLIVPPQAPVSNEFRTPVPILIWRTLDHRIIGLGETRTPTSFRTSAPKTDASAIPPRGPLHCLNCTCVVSPEASSRDRVALWVTAASAPVIRSGCCVGAVKSGRGSTAPLLSCGEAPRIGPKRQTGVVAHTATGLAVRAICYASSRPPLKTIFFSAINVSCTISGRRSLLRVS